jgi:signal transduction histidine kinase
LVLACKEALNNVVKHAAATEVQVSLKVEPTGFVLSLKDNGSGFQLESPVSETGPDPVRSHHGNGLGNIRQRLEEIGGEYEVKSAPRAGTNVIFRVPIKISAS